MHAGNKAEVCCLQDTLLSQRINLAATQLGANFVYWLPSESSSLDGWASWLTISRYLLKSLCFGQRYPTGIRARLVTTPTADATSSPPTSLVMLLLMRQDHLTFIHGEPGEHQKHMESSESCRKSRRLASGCRTQTVPRILLS